jgi:hypothetical protein
MFVGAVRSTIERFPMVMGVQHTSCGKSVMIKLWIWTPFIYWS